MSERPEHQIGVLFDVFALAERVGQLLRLALGPTGLKPVEYGMLSLLTTVGPATPSEISRMTGQPASTMSGYVAALTRRGLIRREPAPGDGRSALLVPTDEGRRLHMAATRPVHQLSSRLRDELGMPLADTRAALLELAAAVDRTIAAAGSASAVGSSAAGPVTPNGGR
ncbi:MarR family winged helix-turn-helix transcriptional regulator [Plantactinospora sp. GCM10030261]|uniref:MarR family winged helix-turn-helix transcriptional regulator n=1 Tax=Plantactinospora sp. GCM10030261 TaxID=3273420 RepID=UPI003606F83C